MSKYSYDLLLVKLQTQDSTVSTEQSSQKPSLTQLFYCILILP